MVGGGSDQPYLYPPCAPLSERRLAYPYSNFNPKAATQAAYQALYDQNRPRPKQDGPLLRFDQPVSSYMVVSGDGVSYTPAAYEALQAKKKTKPEGKGPLVNFNQHPDSWMVMTSQSSKYTPMPASTKTKVTAIRWVQFVLRVLEELGALGLLVCMICFTNMPSAFSWIMRIAPAWDVLVTLYAIYHLVRPARARTPASSASYHIFALINDVVLLPFYIYICLYSRNNYEEDPGNKSRWKTLFSDADIATKLLLATFLGTATIAGLHLLSAILDLWLVVLFKAIAKLPPDVNPLEDNLTSRVSRRSKHKYKNSESTLTDSFSEKHPQHLSGSTLSVDQRSQLSKDINEANSRRVPFDHTRLRSTTTVSSYEPEAARSIHDDFEDVKLYKQSNTPRGSRTNFESPSQMFDTELSKHSSSPSPQEVIPQPPQLSERSWNPSSQPNSSGGTNVTDFAPALSPAVPNAAPPLDVVKSQQKSGLLNNNWYVIGDDESDLGTSSPPRTPAVEYQEENPNRVQSQAPFEPQPLKMNPPTPPLNQAEYADADVQNEYAKYETSKRKPLTSRVDNGNGDLNRAQTVLSNRTGTSSVYSDDELDLQTTVRIAGKPKGKYYGDLVAATRGVLGRTKSKSKATTEVSRISSTEASKSNGTLGLSNTDSSGLSALSRYGYGNGRVVSSGVDVVDGAHADMGLGLRGRRDVSGKVAEEGRGGVWWSRKGY